ncbi:MAG: hypothetical protein HY319_02520 [Armatimonadetes bacterium]|nr:hypothetical protein [Armatimonadota bacterium]
MSFDAYLAQLASMGRLDSRGAFTVELRGAAQRSGYLVAHPSFHALNLVRAANIRAASRIEVKARGNRLRLDFDGTPFLRGELEGLDGRAFQREPADLRLLALSLLTCRSQGGDFELESRGDAGIFLETGPAGLSVSVPREATTPLVTRIETTLPWGGLGGWARRVLAGSAESDLIRRHGLYSAAALYVNGQPIHRPEFGGAPRPALVTSTRSYLGVELSQVVDGSAASRFPPDYHLVERFLTADRWTSATFAAPGQRFPMVLAKQGQAALVAPVHFSHTQSLLHQQRPADPAPRWFEKDLRPRNLARDDEAVPCYAMLAIPTRLSGPGRLVPIRDGIVLGQKSEDLGVPGAVALIACSGLQEDLSQFGLVENEDYGAMLDYLRGQFREMLDDLPEVLVRLQDFELEQWVLDQIPNPARQPELATDPSEQKQKKRRLRRR